MMRDYSSILLGTLRLGRWDRSWADGEPLRVEQGACYPAAMTGQTQASEEAARMLKAIDASIPPVLDRRGHRRMEYQGLLLYAMAQAIRLSPPAKEQEDILLGWGRRLTETTALRFSETIPASEGAAIAGQVWSALALQAIGLACDHQAFCDRTAAVFGDLIQQQSPSGTFLKASSSDNPETHWYHELVILHAVNSFARLARHDSAAQAVRRAAEFHLNETQPDHATNQPWGMAAFLAHTDSTVRGMGEGMLHTARALDGTVGSTHTADSANAKPVWGLTSILLADALYCLTS